MVAEPPRPRHDFSCNSRVGRRLASVEIVRKFFARVFLQLEEATLEVPLSASPFCATDRTGTRRYHRLSGVYWSQPVVRTETLLDVPHGSRSMKAWADSSRAQGSGRPGLGPGMNSMFARTAFFFSPLTPSQQLLLIRCPGSHFHVPTSAGQHSAFVKPVLSTKKSQR